MKKTHKKLVENNSDIVMYETNDGLVKIDVNIKDENVWLNMNQMAELFDRDRSVIGKHIKNVFDEGELEEKSNVQNLPIANSNNGDGVIPNRPFHPKLKENENCVTM